MRSAAAVCLLSVCLSGCARRSVAPAVPERSRAAERGILPAGTSISLRTVSRVEATGAVPAEGFPAVVVGDVVDSSGQVFVSSGAPAKLVILPGQLGLAAIMVYGNWYPVAGNGTHGPGSGAPLGTLVQGVIDTRVAQPPGSNDSMAIRVSGESIQVPAGALLMFRLDQPARIATQAEAAASR